ncbi:MAG: serine/threonine-protein kinase [Gemmatimonadaceae bacterium]
MDELRGAIERAIGNQYEVLHLLGRGGMGAVYLARDRFLDRLVAVKVLPQEAENANARERFLREARTAAKLTHPSIVPLHTFSQVNDTLLYVMGFVEGESLESLLRREGRLPSDQAAQIISEIASALDYAHAMGIVHRDVKPDNILIERETGRAYLTDFGIAKLATGQSMTRTGMVVGTPHYMSPEQSSGDAIDGRTDLYALGIIGYRMATGRLPFDAPGIQELVMQHVAREPVPVAVDESRPGLAGVIMRCLQKNPDERWRTGADIVTALRPREEHELGLPEELAGVPSSLSVAVGLLLLFEMCLFVVAQFTDDPSVRWLMVITPVTTLPILSIGHIVLGKRHGFDWRRVLRMSFWKPAKWSGWWPASLRRPGDVWPRLPREIRRTRAAVTAATASMVGLCFVPLVLSVKWSATGRMDDARILSNVNLGTIVVIMGTMMTYLFRTRTWEKKFKVGAWAAKQLVGMPTWNNSFWKRPEIAAILGPQPGAARARSEAQTAAELVQEIERAATSMSGVLGPAAADAVQAARDVLAFVDEVKRELSALERDADPSERARLADKVAALDASMAKDSARSPMRDLLEQQLALHDQLDGRRRLLLDDHARSLALLKRLNRELALSRTELARDGGSASSLSGQIRVICEDLRIERSAVRQVNELLSPTPAE